EAGVASGALDDDAAGLQVAALFGSGDHRQPDAILDRTARIGVLQLEIQLADTGIEALRLHHGSLADKLENARADAHAGILCWELGMISHAPRLQRSAVAGGASVCLGVVVLVVPAFQLFPHRELLELHASQGARIEGQNAQLRISHLPIELLVLVVELPELVAGVEQRGNFGRGVAFEHDDWPPRWMEITKSLLTVTLLRWTAGRKCHVRTLG